MKTKVLSIIAIAAVLTSCQSEMSSDVNQDRIFTKYILVFESDRDVTYARAWFTFGNELGTLLQLSDPSFVSFRYDDNDKDLNFYLALAFYEDEMAGLVPSGTFHWEDTEGKAFNNTISVTEVAFPEDFTEIDGSQSYELEWVGKALGDDEYVAIAINGRFEGDLFGIYEGGKGSTSIVIPKDKLEGLPKNEMATIWMEFGYSPGLTEETGAGGKITGKYRVVKEIMIL